MRLFAALPLSTPAMDRLTRLRLRLSAPDDGLRWSAPEQWHITLQFYEEIDESGLRCLEQHLRQGTPGAPEIALEELGLFAAKGILFASVSPTPELLALHAHVVQASADCGFLAESRPFRPHITLARSKGNLGGRALRALSTPTLPTLGPELRWTADHVHLVQSTLTPQGARYTTRAQVRLILPTAEARPS